MKIIGVSFIKNKNNNLLKDIPWPFFCLRLFFFLNYLKQIKVEQKLINLYCLKVFFFYKKKNT